VTVTTIAATASVFLSFFTPTASGQRWQQSLLMVHTTSPNVDKDDPSLHIDANVPSRQAFLFFFTPSVSMATSTTNAPLCHDQPWHVDANMPTKLIFIFIPESHL